MVFLTEKLIMIPLFQVAEYYITSSHSLLWTRLHDESTNHPIWLNAIVNPALRKFRYPHLTLYPDPYKVKLRIWIPDIHQTTVYSRSRDPFYIVSYYIKRITTSWTYSNNWIRILLRSTRIPNKVRIMYYNQAIEKKSFLYYM